VRTVESVARGNCILLSTGVGSRDDLYDDNGTMVTALTRAVFDLNRRDMGVTNVKVIINRELLGTSPRVTVPSLAYELENVRSLFEHPRPFTGGDSPHAASVRDRVMEELGLEYQYDLYTQN
jgi:hypothetical protein